MEAYVKRITASEPYYPYSYIIFNLAFPVLIGLLLALPGLADKFKSGGQWRYDWVKLLAVGLPTLFIAISVVLFFSTPIGRYMPDFLFSPSPIPQTICGVVFGYLVLSVFYKK